MKCTVVVNIEKDTTRFCPEEALTGWSWCRAHCEQRLEEHQKDMASTLACMKERAGVLFELRVRLDTLKAKQREDANRYRSRLHEVEGLTLRLENPEP